MATKAQLESKIVELESQIVTLTPAPAPAPVDAPEAEACEKTKSSFKKAKNWKFHTKWCKSHTRATNKTAPTQEPEADEKHDCLEVHPEHAYMSKNGTPRTGHMRWAWGKAPMSESTLATK